MSWAEVKKINSDLSVPLDKYHKATPMEYGSPTVTNSSGFIYALIRIDSGSQSGSVTKHYRLYLDDDVEPFIDLALKYPSLGYNSRVFFIPPGWLTIDNDSVYSLFPHYNRVAGVSNNTTIQMIGLSDSKTVANGTPIYMHLLFEPIYFEKGFRTDNLSVHYSLLP